jgi:tRNA modification GTPase
MVDSQQTPNFDPHTIWPEFVNRLPDPSRLTVIANKADLSQLTPGLLNNSPALIAISAHTGEGVEALQEHLKDVMGFTGASEGGFTARRRHLDALERAAELLLTGKQQLHAYAAGELLAEDLRQAQNALSEITGEFTSDDLLGRIFSSFCIGK